MIVLDNAVKYSERGGTVRLDAGVRTRHGRSSLCATRPARSTRRSCRASSTASIAAATRPCSAPAAAASDSPSPAGWWRSRAARSRSTATGDRWHQGRDRISGRWSRELVRARPAAQRAPSLENGPSGRRTVRRCCLSRTIAGSRASSAADWRPRAISSTSPRAAARRSRSRARPPTRSSSSTACCPGLDGLNICRSLRAGRQRQHDPDADRQGQPAGQARRARQRRRRLSDKAIRLRRAARPHARPAAPRAVQASRESFASATSCWTRPITA